MAVLPQWTDVDDKAGHAPTVPGTEHANGQRVIRADTLYSWSEDPCHEPISQHP
jgi:hypothetical protein